MTKHFCDLCGESAVEHWPSLKAKLPDKEWFGTKFSSGSISCVDGRWTPQVEARMIFELHDMPNSTKNYNPDLCFNCIAGLLRQMADSITQPAAQSRQ